LVMQKYFVARERNDTEQMALYAYRFMDIVDTRRAMLIGPLWRSSSRYFIY
jgi:hypothetical protein